MKYTLNWQFITLGKNLLYSEWVKTQNEKLALGRCHIFYIKMNVMNNQNRENDKNKWVNMHINTKYLYWENCEILHNCCWLYVWKLWLY